MPFKKNKVAYAVFLALVNMTHGFATFFEPRGPEHFPEYITRVQLWKEARNAVKH